MIVVFVFTLTDVTENGIEWRKRRRRRRKNEQYMSISTVSFSHSNRCYSLFVFILSCSSYALVFIFIRYYFRSMRNVNESIVHGNDPVLLIWNEKKLLLKNWPTVYFNQHHKVQCKQPQSTANRTRNKWMFFDGFCCCCFFQNRIDVGFYSHRLVSRYHFIAIRFRGKRKFQWTVATANGNGNGNRQIHYAY